MAAERTFFSILRTGLAIAGAGTVIVSILGSSWPDWLSVALASVFIFVGYTMMLVGLRSYRTMAAQLAPDSKLQITSPALITFLTIVLQVAVILVVGLYLLSLSRIDWPWLG
jgi:uncharacterized membrane protein YidH (DUF202 family)